MAAASRPSTLVKETENNESSLKDPGHGLGQEQGQRYVLELPRLDLTINLGDWMDGHEKGHGENTTRCPIDNEPLNRNDNTSDSETIVKRPEPFNGNGNTLDSKTAGERPEPVNGNDLLPETPPPRLFQLLVPRAFEAVRGSVKSTANGNTSDLEIPVERPCDYILNKNSLPRWFEQRNSFPTWQQVHDKLPEVFAEEDDSIYIICLDYLAAFMAESSMLHCESENLDVNQESRRQELEDRERELWRRVAVPVFVVKELSEKLFYMVRAQIHKEFCEMRRKRTSGS